MNKWRGLVLSGCVLALTACSNFDAHSEVKALNEVQPVGSAFTQALTGEYRDLVNYQMDESFGYPDALHFARKGLAAASGEIVMPEPVSDWNLQPNQILELSTGRGRLIQAYDLGARELAAEKSAAAQGSFDCWIEHEEEVWVSKKTASSNCKNRFLSLMNELENMLPKPQPMPEFEPPVESVVTAPAETMRPEDAMYLVFFDFDKTSITPGGRSVLESAAQEATRRNLNAINVIGHTDSSGPNSYNDRLAVRRANAVRDALVSLGVDPALIRVDGRGEKQLMVATPDGVREPANRRAEITFE